MDLRYRQGRLHLEREFGNLIDAREYVECVHDGEAETAQPNLGRTIETKTPVAPTSANGNKNLYYQV